MASKKKLLTELWTFWKGLLAVSLPMHLNRLQGKPALPDVGDIIEMIRIKMWLHYCSFEGLVAFLVSFSVDTPKWVTERRPAITSASVYPLAFSPFFFIWSTWLQGRHCCPYISFIQSITQLQLCSATYVNKKQEHLELVLLFLYLISRLEVYSQTSFKGWSLHRCVF